MLACGSRQPMHRDSGENWGAGPESGNPGLRATSSQGKLRSSPTREPGGLTQCKALAHAAESPTGGLGPWRTARAPHAACWARGPASGSRLQVLSSSPPSLSMFLSLPNSREANLHQAGLSTRYRTQGRPGFKPAAPICVREAQRGEAGLQVSLFFSAPTHPSQVL